MTQLEGMADVLNLGVAVRTKRLMLGWTQGALAAQSGVSQGALSAFERSGQGMRLDRMLDVLRTVGFRLYVETEEGG